MDNMSMAAGGIAHRVEIYTNLLMVQGIIKGPFKRTSDLLNWNDLQFFSLQGAVVTPAGQPTAEKAQEQPVYIGRSQVHFAVELAEDLTSLMNTGSLDEMMDRRPTVIRKESKPCYALTGSYIIHANCHLLPGAVLENLLVGSEDFIPLTQATIRHIARPDAPWRREIVIVNRNMLTAMYLA